MASLSGPGSGAPHPYLCLEGAEGRWGLEGTIFCISLTLHRKQKVTLSSPRWTSLLDPREQSQYQNHPVNFRVFRPATIQSHHPGHSVLPLSVTPSSPLNCVMFFSVFLFLSFEGSCHWLFGPSVFGFQTYRFLYSSLSRRGMGQVSQQTLGTLSGARPRMPYTKATFLNSASSNCLPHTCCHSHIAELLLQWKAVSFSKCSRRTEFSGPTDSLYDLPTKEGQPHPSQLRQQVSHVSPPVLSRLLLCS